MDRMRYYTGRGDSGETDTMGFGRISKGSALANLLGDIDELNSVIGIAIVNTTDSSIAGMMKTLQDKLFKAGADAASSTINKKAKRITKMDVEWIEEQADDLSSKIPDIKKFVLPGGSIAGSYLHLARSVARRAERSAAMLSKRQKINPELLAFLNRTSSLLFVCALYMNKKAGAEEDHPRY
ncbi:MAG: cob(I)yrinic acid a,c-diamide adenosyltransferase [Candidatus Marsarchaeota archaeon]|jgi:cob(I)alamin adenosyltransferase|nr:cob(I)yrinic acid a,c-diamide adenosyltransferase [Candidatus Marsarchaeota archaeon]MCL5111916.1 cob(I)yrinic acid a,c-diamide adenosyltransferase [Candidatus Marsarchaeota archaeon]